LRDRLALGARGNDEIELLTELLALPSTAADLNLSPQRKREKLLESLLHQLEALALRGPVLMVFEDAHWADPTSRELLDLTVDRVARVSCPPCDYFPAGVPARLGWRAARRPAELEPAGRAR